MGIVCPPLYGTENIVNKIDKIAKLDEKINALLIERETEYDALKKAIKDSKKN